MPVILPKGQTCESEKVAGSAVRAERAGRRPTDRTVARDHAELERLCDRVVRRGLPGPGVGPALLEHLDLEHPAALGRAAHGSLAPGPRRGHVGPPALDDDV